MRVPSKSGPLVASSARREAVPSGSAEGFQRAAGQAVDDEGVPGRLEVRGQRPQHLAVVGHVHVGVHRDHRLQVGIPAQQAQHRLAGVAGPALIDREVAVEVRARVGVVDSPSPPGTAA